MEKYLQLENKDYEMLEKINGDCYIKDKKTNKYYFKHALFASKSLKFENIKEIKSNFFDKLLSILVALSALMFAYILFHMNFIYGFKMLYTWRQYIETLLFLILNVVLHEFAHAFTMKIFGRKVNKIGFRFNFIFPCFFVNTSDSYILPRMRRFFVYYSGIMINIFTTFFIITLVPQYYYWTRLVFWTVLINLLPISALKTDGYHLIFNVIFGINDMRQSKKMLFIVVKYLFIAIVSILMMISLFKVFGFIK